MTGLYNLGVLPGPGHHRQGVLPDRRSVLGIFDSTASPDQLVGYSMLWRWFGGDHGMRREALEW